MDIIGKNGYQDPLQQREGQRHHLKGTERVHLALNHINNLITARNMDAELVKVNYVTVLCSMANLLYDKVSFFFQNWHEYHHYKCIKYEICLVCWILPVIQIHGKLRQKDDQNPEISLHHIVNSSQQWTTNQNKPAENLCLLEYFTFVDNQKICVEDSQLSIPKSS